MFHLCCNRPMHSHGALPDTRRRYRCSVCGTVKASVPLRLPRREGDTSTNHGRHITYLDPDHPMANSAGWQYTHRVVVYNLLGRVLYPDEQVDHIDGDIANNNPHNLRLLLDIDHGRHHHYTQGKYKVIAQWVEGEFVEYDTPMDMGY